MLPGVRLELEGVLMNRVTRICLYGAVAGVLSVNSALRAATPTTQPDTAELMKEIQELRSEVQELKAQRNTPAAPATAHADSSQPGLSLSKSEDSDADNQSKTAADVQADADRRSNMMDMSGTSAGYDPATHRFYIASEDGNFVWRPWLHAQLRYIAMWRQDYNKDGTDQTDTGFELRRMRFGFDGNMFGQNLTYFFNWATNRANGTSTVKDSSGAAIGTVSNNLGGVPLLEEAWVKYHIPKTDFYLKGGQIKDPVEHDQIVSSRYQQSDERSLTGDIFFNGDAFTEGATVIYDPKTFIRAEAGVNHGMRSANTNFLDNPTNVYDFGVVGRAEWKLMGNWADYNQIGAIDVKQPLLVFGIGCDYSQRDVAGQTVGAVDASYSSPNGLSLLGIFADRYTTHNFGIYTQSPTGASIGTPDPAVAGKPTNEYSIVGQVGYLVNQKWEPFGRFEYLQLAGTPAGSHNSVPAVCGGMNYYFFSYRAKLTAQATWLPNGIPIDDGPNDIYASPNGNQEISFGAQFQLLI
jgi:hypothetical protein